MNAVDAQLVSDVTGRFARRRMMAFAIPAAILIYLTCALVSFDVTGLAKRAKLENAAILLSDFWSHKTHVTRDNRTGKIVVAIEGEAKGTYPEGLLPDWVDVEGPVTTIDLHDGYLVT